MQRKPQPSATSHHQASIHSPARHLGSMPRAWEMRTFGALVACDGLANSLQLIQLIHATNQAPELANFAEH